MLALPPTRCSTSNHVRSDSIADVVGLRAAGVVALPAAGIAEHARFDEPVLAKGVQQECPVVGMPMGVRAKAALEGEVGVCIAVNRVAGIWKKPASGRRG